MPNIFKSIQPNLKETRTTRSQSRNLKKIKRVVSTADTNSNTFFHVCEISINDRLTALGTNCTAVDDPITASNSNQFLSNHCISKKLSLIYVSFENYRKSSAENGSLEINEMEDNTEITDSNSKGPHEDEVIVVSPQDESVILLDDSNISSISNSHRKSCDFSTNRRSCRLSSKRNIQPNLNRDISVITIPDEDDQNAVYNIDDDKSIIFVREDVLEPTTPTLINCRFVSSPQVNSQRTSRRRNRPSSKLKGRTLKKKKRGTNLPLLTSISHNKDKLNSHRINPLNSNFNGLPFSNNPFSNISPRRLLRLSSFRQLFDSNFTNGNVIKRTGLREIIIDGSNVALGHTNGRCFSVKGLKIAIDHFVQRGHKVTAFVPQYRQKYNQTTDSSLLKSLADQGYVVFTPSREVNGRRITPYDDRYIIQYASSCEGIVVSSDNYRDLFLEKQEWRSTIEERLLMPTWVGDMLMFPEDPLGRHGPKLSRFLSFP